MAAIRIRVGAYMDRSFDTVLRTMTDASRRAQRKVAQESVQTADVQVVAARKAANDTERAINAAARAEERAKKKAAQDAEKAALAKTKAAEKEAKAHIREFERVTKAEEKELAKRARQQARASRGMTGGSSLFNRVANEVKNVPSATGQKFLLLTDEIDQNIRKIDEMWRKANRPPKKPSMTARTFGVQDSSVLRGTVRAGKFIAREGLDVARSIAAGAGVDFSLQNFVSKNVALESAAASLSNQGFMANENGPNGRRQAPTALIQQARDVANRTAFDPGQVFEGLSKFTGKTGDLDTGRQILERMAVLSKATGTNLEDMVDAAADASNVLGDVPNKAGRINEIMTAIAGQGKLGAVEISDLARQMAKVAASTTRFEGDRAKNIVLAGAFAQEARQRGGAASAPQAATAVMAFANQFQKSARFSEMRALGIDPRSKTEKGKFRDPSQVLLEVIQKTGGDPLLMNKVFMDASAQRVSNGFASVYRDAYNATSGTEQEKVAAATKAFRDELERLTKAAMGQGEVQDSFNAAMNTTESKVQQFNNQLQGAASQVQGVMLPAMASVAPAAIGVAKGLAALLEKLAKFIPGDAITDVEPTTDVVAKAAGAENRLQNLLDRAGNFNAYLSLAPQPEKKADRKKAEAEITDAANTLSGQVPAAQKDAVEALAAVRAERTKVQRSIKDKEDELKKIPTGRFRGERQTEEALEIDQKIGLLKNVESSLLQREDALTGQLAMLQSVFDGSRVLRVEVVNPPASKPEPPPKHSPGGVTGPGP